MADNYYTIEEAAERMNCSPKIVRTHIHRGELNAVNISTGHRRKAWRIPPQAIADFDRRRQAAPVPIVGKRRKLEPLPEDVIEFVRA